jgi:hypothetical protein
MAGNFGRKEADSFMMLMIETDNRDARDNN